VTERRVGGEPTQVPRVQTATPAAETFATGDARARLAAVYEAHADFVVRVARQLGAPAAELEDVVHDVFLVLHRRLDDYHPELGSMRGWLCGICRNVVHHRLRGSSRAEQRLRLLPEPAPRPGPDETLAEAQALAAVQGFLDGLEEGRRMVFALIDIEGLRAPEVAQALGLNLNTVYSRLRLARQQFEVYIQRLRAGPGGSDGRA
jgi:RNA polymerase sigma-70 factor, ECF subfamily